MLIFLFSSVCIVCQPSEICSKPIGELEFLALQSLYYSLNGYNWNWHQPYEVFGNPWNFTDTDAKRALELPCGNDWQGITCSENPENVLECVIDLLEIRGVNATGSLPTSIGTLTNLVSLILIQNQITGTVPSEIGLLSNLELFEFSESPIEGTIPSEFGNLVKLTSVSFFDTYLSGTIPSSLSNLTNIFKLVLDYNDFTGTIPQHFDQLQCFCKRICSVVRCL